MAGGRWSVVGGRSSFDERNANYHPSSNNVQRQSERAVAGEGEGCYQHRVIGRGEAQDELGEQADEPEGQSQRVVVKVGTVWKVEEVGLEGVSAPSQALS